MAKARVSEDVLKFGDNHGVVMSKPPDLLVKEAVAIPSIRSKICSSDFHRRGPQATGKIGFSQLFSRRIRSGICTPGGRGKSRVGSEKYPHIITE